MAFHVPPHARSLAALMTNYANVPMSLADACLVRMTELDDRSAVMTLDGDFLVYRRHGRQAIPALMPPELSATGCYDVRRASVGSTLVARRAGT